MSVVQLPNAGQETHRVVVGPSGTFDFAPDTITAKAGDIVIFEMASPIHTITQSVGVEDPCVQRGFSSNIGDPNFDIIVNNTEPIYVSSCANCFGFAQCDSRYNWLTLSQIFCAPHCSLGMVLIINPGQTVDHALFAAAAQGLPSIVSRTASLALTPTSIGNATSSTVIHTGSTGTGSATAAGAASTNTVSLTSHRNIILGGVLGASILLAFALAIALIIRRRIRNRAIAFGQPRALRPPSAGVPVRERNTLKEKGQAAEASSDARIDQLEQGETGTDARLRAALDALAALQTEVKELRQLDGAETLPEYESRDGDTQRRTE